MAFSHVFTLRLRCRAVRTLLLSVCLCIVCGPCGYAQSIGDTEQRPGAGNARWVPSIATLGQNALEIAESPFQLSRSEQLFTLGASGLVMSTAMALDRPAYTYASIESGPVSKATGVLAAPGRWYDRLGPDRFALGTAGLLAGGGLLLRQKKWTRTSVHLVEALVYTKLITGAAKSVLNRTRPYAAAGPFSASPGAFDSAHEHLSMPSGHTARAFAVASVLAHQFPRPEVRLPAYAVAASVATERVRSGDHWLTDVLVGGALGYVIGRSVAGTAADRPDITYQPILQTNRLGVLVRF